MLRCIQSSKSVTIAEGEDVLDGVGILRNSTCVFRNTEPNLVSFYNDQQITEEVVEFPPGSLLVSFVKEKNVEDNSQFIKECRTRQFDFWDVKLRDSPEV